MFLKTYLLNCLLTPVSRVYSFDKIKKWSVLPVIPMYHAVGKARPAHLTRLPVFRSIKQFKKDLDFLLKHFEPVEMGDLNKTTRKPRFFLTFDDGLKECYEVVFPLLKEKGIPAAFFINSDFIDNKNLFFRFKAALLFNHIKQQKIKYPAEKLFQIQHHNQNRLEALAEKFNYSFEEYLKNNPVYMSSEELKTIHQHGYVIGGHSLNHPEYSKLSLEEQLFQTQENLKKLRRLLKDESINDFAFPFTDIGVKKAFWEQNKLRYSFGGSGLKHDEIPNHFHRIPFDRNNENAEKILRKEYVYFSIKKLFGKNTFKRS